MWMNLKCNLISERHQTNMLHLYDAFSMTSGKGKTTGMEIRSVITGAGRDDRADYKTHARGHVGGCHGPGGVDI